MSNASGPLAGYSVIDFGQYLPGPLTAMLLADQGAEVIRIDPPGGPRWKTAANAVLNRGKKSIVLDLKKSSDQEIARELVRSADVVIENFRPDVMERLGVGAKWARAENPDLIYLSIPGFPESDKRRRHWRAWEGVVAAATSHYRDTGIRKLLIEDAPLYTALPMTSYYAAIEGAIAVSLSLLRRQKTGQGAALEVPLLNASMSAFGYMSLSIHDLPERYQEIALKRFPEMRTRDEYAAMRAIYDECGTPLYLNYRCADGRLLSICADLNRLHTDRAVRVLGLEKMLADLGFRRDDLYADSGPSLAKNLYSANHWSTEDRRVVREHLRKVFATRPAREWEKELGDAGVPCAMQRGNEEYIREDWVRDAKLMCQVMTPDHGPMWQPNRLVYFPGDADPSPELPSPKRLDEDRNEILGRLRDGATKKDPQKAYCQRLPNPLNGITVLDLTNVISGPTCGRTLAECGADVIKIDSPNPSHGPSTSVITAFDVNRGKRSILLDLKKREAKEVFDKLLRKADVVIYNGPNEVMQRLGVTYSDLSKVNPRVIVCQISAFGSPGGGPWAKRQAYDEVVQAANGCQVRFGGAEDPLLHGTASCLDFSTGYIGALAVSLALVRREKTGVGSQVCTSLALAGQLVQLPFCFDFDGRGRWDEPQGQDAIGSGPLERIYKAADGWIFISHPQAEASRLAEIPELGLRGNESLEALERSLEAVLVSRTTREWEDLLNPRQVGAHRVLSLSEIRAAHLRDIDEPGQFVDSNRDESPVFLRYTHEIGATVEHLAPSWIRGDLAGLRMGAAAPRNGEHTETILQELGYGSRDITSLIDTGAVATQVGANEKYLPR
ncbi:CoA transferase [Mesorhizobium sp. M0036]|uniref:CaiB/BaiF CoA transferase family protein n=1 Tax=Mesorhizobium sp. M0036 TaxID=2956853 RepID=UPI00333D712E